MDKPRLVCLFVGLLVVSFLFFPAEVRASVGATPTSVSFGSVTVNTASAAAAIVLTNNGRQSVMIDSVSSNLPQFIVTNPAMPMSLGAHSYVTLQVVFQPNAAQTFNGSIVIATGRRGGHSETVQVSGTGAPVVTAPASTYLLSTSAGSLSFGNTLVGSAASQSITLTNTGTGSVNISQVAATGAGFSVTGFSGAVPLATGQSLAITASFAPASAGSVSGSISVVSTATNSPATIALSGTGVQPQISVVPSSVSFGNVTVGVTNTQTLTIRNPGTAILSVTQASLAGTGFSLSGLALPLSVAPGGSSSFTVGFAPASASSFAGSVTLISNAPSSPLAVSVGGTGIAATLQLSVSPASLNFGSLTTGTSATQSVTLSNTGNSSISISQISASGGGFSDNGFALPLTLAAGQSASFSVLFAPTATGSVAGSVTVSSNAANSPQVIALSGSGTAPVSYTVALSWTPSSPTFSGFNIYRGAISGGPYTRVDGSMISTASFTDTGVTPGQTYYYVATEVDSSGAESAYSSEVSATIP
ncbi:MAG TPA: choice-of-anchor D domain-containing protein [Candidatus Acidoferrum sp.]|nr:choice-of-anchor D domain-containing protein [Candidatus Acidoferrum sp.]